MTRLIIIAVLLVLQSYNSYALSDQGKSIVVENIYARPTIGSIRNSAVYFTIINKSNKKDTITSVNSPIAKRVEIHTHQKNNGTMMMMKVEDPVVIPAKGKIKFISGGLHIMLIGLGRKLKEGDEFPLTFFLKRRGDLLVRVKVQKPDIKKILHQHSGHKM